jgi:hypothetical protein
MADPKHSMRMRRPRPSQYRLTRRYLLVTVRKVLRVLTGPWSWGRVPPETSRVQAEARCSSRPGSRRAFAVPRCRRALVRLRTPERIDCRRNRRVSRPAQPHAGRKGTPMAHTIAAIEQSRASSLHRHASGPLVAARLQVRTELAKQALLRRFLPLLKSPGRLGARYSGGTPTGGSCGWR